MDERQDIILIDLGSASGVRTVARISREDLAAKSQEIIEGAMNTIRAMSGKIFNTVKSIKISERPTKVEVEFGIKFDAEAGALVAKASTETAITVTLTWEHKS